MTDLVPADQIERLVGARRHPVAHLGRADSKAQTVSEQAERVAWRVVKDWLGAQLALVSAQMVSLDEVMLPYLVIDDGRTLREQWRERLALPAGSGR